MTLTLPSSSLQKAVRWVEAEVLIVDEKPELRDPGDAKNVKIIKLTPVGNGNLKAFPTIALRHCAE